ncbi:MAG: PspC domain-containing protein [Croceibacterium sp.]|jgi:phage shock protein C
MNQIQNGGQLRLDKANAKIWGVCAGLANYFGIDPLMVRLLFVVGALAGFGSFILIYLVMALLVK